MIALTAAWTVLAVGLAAAPSPTALDAGRQLGASYLRTVSSLPTTERPTSARIQVEPVDDAKRLEGITQGVRESLSTGGVRFPENEIDVVDALITLRALPTEEGHRAALTAVGANTGAVLCETSVTLVKDALATPEGGERLASRDVDGAAVKLAAAIAGALDTMPGDVRYQRVAVMPLEDRGPGAKEAKAGEALSVQLQKLLSEQHRINVVDRKALSRVLANQSLAQATGNEGMVRTGQLLDAQAMVMGSVSDAGEQFLVSLRLISVTTGEVLVARSATMPRKGVVALSNSMLELKDRGSATFRSVIVPGWGQIFLGQRLKGSLLMSSAVVFATLGAVLLASGAAVHIFYALTNPYAAINTTLPGGIPVSFKPFSRPGVDSADEFEQTARTLRSVAASLYILGAMSVLVTGAVWIFNVADAYAFGAPE
ncbi:MAG: FlgO family outer membrane protein [Myxococcota bacterium]